ncbi:MAG: hypothetical protein AAFY09_00900 [Pseudomonadota bacterium]
MRTAFVLFVMTAQTAHAWEFTPGIPCRLTHETARAGIELTYDPTGSLYTLTITRDAPWPDEDRFEMRFDGPRGLRIGTDRHALSNNGRSLSVADAGFGNVLDGLQFNDTATAITGDTEVTFPLAGASEPVAAFRACEANQPSA